MHKIIMIATFLAMSLFGQTKVLFLGNSYTAGSYLPGLVENLAIEAGYDISVNASTPGGYTLKYHFESSTSMGLIASDDWDYVVMQEQSQMPVIPFYRDGWTVPYAESLCIEIKEICARPVFFMAWGAEIGGQECIEGHCSVDFDDYFHQQDSVSATYERIAMLNDASCAPAGYSWRLSQEINPAIGLWSSDGRHPNLGGSYLAACAIYSTIFETRTYGNAFHSTLDSTTAGYLQQIADSVVFNDLDRWIRDAITVEADFVWIESDGEVAFTDSSINAVNFFWDFGDGDISTERNPLHIYTSTGDFEVMLIAFGGCKIDTMYQTVHIPVTAVVDEKDVAEVYSISFPNPISSEFLDIRNHKIERIEIFDLRGNLVLRNESANNVPLMNLTNGIYLILIKSRNSTISKRIAILR